MVAGATGHHGQHASKKVAQIRVYAGTVYATPQNQLVEVLTALVQALRLPTAPYMEAGPPGPPGHSVQLHVASL